MEIAEPENCGGWLHERRTGAASQIEKNDYNLNISRYISTAVGEEEIDLLATHSQLRGIEEDIRRAREKHNAFLQELGLPLLP